MPFAWAVILIQVGYLGFLLNKKNSMLLSTLLTFFVGMFFIPIFECCAKYAGWWRYEVTDKMFANTPYYIILGEGLICMVLPFLFKKLQEKSVSHVALVGLLTGIWILVSYYISYNLVG